jgi:glycine/D-amino acid oxidase-like deaminating enzyme
MARKRVGIIGAGIVGTALAYYLSEYDNVQVTVFDKNSVGSGTTAKSAGTVCLFDDSVTHEFWPVRLKGFQTYTTMEEEDEGSAGFQQTGTLVVATDEEVQDFIKEGIAKAQAAGYNGEYLTDHNAIHKIVPDLNLEGVLGAGYTPDDGFFDATMIANTYATKARANGAKVLTFTEVTGVTMAGGRATGVQTRKGDFDFDVVVDATGPWARFTGRMAGLELPIWHTKAEVFVLEPRPQLEYAFPVLKYPRFYARREQSDVFICKAHLTMDLSDPVHAGIWNPDELPLTGGTEQYFLDFLYGELEKHYPRLLDTGIKNDWVGYRAETPDFLPILGDSPVEGYLLNVGYGGNGVIDAPAAGIDLAKYIATGEKPALLERLRFARFGETKAVGS